jgi:dimethylamine--corrinoid protein Co-methyltransferase
MATAHAIASGMGGMRAAGDLVARVQMAKAMKTKEAKEYVAGKLKLSVSDLTDPILMAEVREELQLGTITPRAECAKGIEAKFRMAEVLGLDINCVEQFKKRISK